jgi:hypothetical protein
VGICCGKQVVSSVRGGTQGIAGKVECGTVGLKKHRFMVIIDS